MSDVLPDPDPPGDDDPGAFPEAARAWIGRLFALRRDVRHFLPGAPIDEAALRRVLSAAHAAPSVGFSQPWRFVLLRDPARRARIRESFLACRRAEASRFSEERRAQYLSLKLEGIVDAPLNLCVVADLRPQGEAVLGTTVQPESVRASVLCAVQNLWLAARAEGLGVGWVSVVEPSVLRAELGLPAGVEPVAYLCVGTPARPYLRPMLEEVGWRQRLPLEAVIREEGWPADDGPGRAWPWDPSRPAPFSPEQLDERRRMEGQAWSQRVVPPKACGRLEALATHWGVWRHPEERPVPRLLIFAADHGVTREGVSAYGSTVTLGMLAAIMAGHATSSVLAERFGIPIALCDVGTASDRSALPRAPRIALQDYRIAAGTGNLAREAAMSPAECARALSVGGALVAQAVADGANLIGLGELGIGNTTSAAALIAACLGLDAQAVVGRGTGLDDGSVAHKAQVIAAALDRVRGRPFDALEVLAELGGFELAALVGALLEAARLGVVVVLDGAVTGAAALVAERVQPGATASCIASHQGAERGAALALEALALAPLLAWDLCLGEGAGAALGIDLVMTAVSLRRTLATFPEAGLLDRVRADGVLHRISGQE